MQETCERKKRNLVRSSIAGESLAIQCYPFTFIISLSNTDAFSHSFYLSLSFAPIFSTIFPCMYLFIFWFSSVLADCATVAKNQHFYGLICLFFALHFVLGSVFFFLSRSLHVVVRNVVFSGKLICMCCWCGKFLINCDNV